MTGVELKLPFTTARNWQKTLDLKWPSEMVKTQHTTDDSAIVKQNPLFFDDQLLTTTTTGRKRLLVSWNPKFVLKIEIRGVNIEMKNDYDTDKVSRSSSEIDEDLFDMSQIPSLPEPKITSHPFILPERMIKDLSLRLAVSRERNLLTSTLAKTDRFNEPGNSRIDYESMFPIFNQLDTILINSRTIDTFKAKVHSAKERLQRTANGQTTPPLQVSDETNGKRPGRLKRFYQRKRRLFQALIALVLLIVFLSMLISLSICCSNRNKN